LLSFRTQPSRTEFVNADHAVFVPRSAPERYARRASRTGAARAPAVNPEPLCDCLSAGA